MSGGWMHRLRALKSRAVRLAGPVGLYALARGLTRAEPRILMYHRFGTTGTPPGVPPAMFHDQIKLLKARFRIVTLAELAARIEADSIEPGLAVITVDDGYEDFYRVAFPLLQSEGVPATFFVTTGFLDGDLWLWPDALEYLLAHSDVPHPDLADFGVTDRVDTRTAAGRDRAWHGMLGHFLDLMSAQRSRRLDDLARVLGLGLPAVPDRDHVPCSWDDIRAMSRAGIEIGAHTVTHPRLPRESDADLRAELGESKRRIEEEIGREVTSFCYPNGSPADYDDRVADAVRDAGFRCAVAAHFDGQDGDIFRLRRLGVGKDMFQYHKSIAGVEHVGLRLRRRNVTAA